MLCVLARGRRGRAFHVQSRVCTKSIPRFIGLCGISSAQDIARRIYRICPANVEWLLPGLCLRGFDASRFNRRGKPTVAFPWINVRNWIGDTLKWPEIIGKTVGVGPHIRLGVEEGGGNENSLRLSHTCWESNFRRM